MRLRLPVPFLNGSASRVPVLRERDRQRCLQQEIERPRDLGGFSCDALAGRREGHRSGSTVTVPYRLNPGFGSLLARSDRGRQIRVGLRLGAPR